MAKEDFKRIGAGWKKTSKNGNTYLSIQFNAEAIANLDLSQLNIMVFPSKEKKNPSSPDYTISATEKRVHNNPPRREYAPPAKPGMVPRIPQARPPVKNHAPAALDPEDDF